MDSAPPVEDERSSDGDADTARDVLETEARQRTEPVETSEELASITLADIFASQGYISKAEKIYKEVLNKQPGNETVRRKLEELASGSADEHPNETDPDLHIWVEFTPDRRNDDPAVGEGMRSDDERVIEVDLDGDTAGEKKDAQGSARIPAGRDAGKDGAASAAPPRRTGKSKYANDENGDAYRPAIGDSDSLSHFRHWLKQMRK